MRGNHARSATFSLGVQNVVRQVLAAPERDHDARAGSVEGDVALRTGLRVRQVRDQRTAIARPAAPPTAPIRERRLVAWS